MSRRQWRDIVRTVGLGLARFFSAVFGTFQWKSPAWLTKAKDKLAPPVLRAFSQFKIWAQQNKSLLQKSGLGLFVVAALAVGGYVWWEQQPKPKEVDFVVTPPRPTELEDKAKPHVLELVFNDSVAALDAIGKSVKTGVQLSPTKEGTWKWETDRKLVFEPTTDWPVDQKYKVSLERSQFPKHLRLKDYDAVFATEPFQVTKSSAEFYRHPENPKEKRVLATLHLNYPVDPATLKDRVKIVLNGDKSVIGDIPREYKAEVTYDKFFGEIYVKSEILPMPLKDTVASIEIDSGWKSSHGGNKIPQTLKLTANVPGMLTYFKIASAHFQFAESPAYELEQVIAVETSIEVLETEFDKSFQVYLLPERSKNQAAENKEPYSWAPGEVSPEILSASQKISYQRVPSEKPQTKLHTFKVRVPQGRHLYISVSKGLKSFHEYILGENFSAVLKVLSFPSEIRILHEGSILSLSGDKKLSILARGIRSFQIKVGHVLPDQLNHLLSQTGGTFAQPSFNNSYAFDWENITEQFSEVITVAETKTGKPEFTAFDAGKFFNKSQGPGRGLLYVTLTPYDKDKKHTYGNSDSRFLLITDLGVIDKKMPDHSHEIFVQSVHTGQPVAGATVEVIGKNGVAVLSATSNDQGRVRMASLEDFKNEKAPLAFVVRKGNDLSFLPTQRYDRKLQYSKFDVGGVRTGGEENRLQGYVFTDRGMYRPGESAHLTSIIRSFDWKAQLQDVPVEWVITDPKGQEFYKEKVSLTAQGFTEVKIATQNSSFVGTYTGAIYIIKDNRRDAMIGSTTFRVEEFVADRMKISTGFTVPATTGWTNPESLKAWVRVMNLFGFPAEGRAVRVKMHLSPAAPFFPGYKEYSFFLPKTDKSFDSELSANDTDAKGETDVELEISKFEKGNYRLRIEAEANELEGGRAVAAMASIMVSPFKYFIGSKSASDLNYLKAKTQHQIEYIAIDPNLKKTTVKDLNLVLIERQWVSVLAQQSNGTFKYESVRRDKELKKDKIKITDKGFIYPVPTDLAGDFKIVLSSGDGVEVSTVEFTVVGEGNVLGRVDRQAELQVRLEKSDYSEGEEIEMQIRAPYVGSGLITIERDKVYAAKWFKTTSNNSIQKFKVPAGLEGTAYVNVTFLRDVASREIFMSPLSYSVVPFSIDLKKRQLNVQVKAVPETRPGQPLTIEYSANKPGKIVIFAVDEGILQVGKYQTPDPLGSFFKKRALEVETAQLLDLLLPEYKIVQMLAAAGGDGMDSLARNLNPFKRKNKPPIAFWSGIIDVDPTKKSVTYNVPDYFNGTLRIMAVAVTSDSVGVAKTESLVRGDFIMTPTIPAVLTPGDEVSIGVSVFNNLKGSGPNAKIKLAVKGSSQIEILEGANSELAIAETKEIGTTIKIRAKDQLGVARLELVASSGDKSAKLTEEISLRPATPYRTQVWGGALSAGGLTGGLVGGSKTVELAGKFYPDLARRTASVSFLPLSLAHGLSEFLTDFPYGCTEQLISKAMPTLILGDKPDFKFKPEQRDLAFKNAIATLRQRQLGDGGFALYSGYGNSSLFPSLYAIHYLVEAKFRGHVAPADMLDRAKAYLHQLVRESATDIYKARSMAFALYLLTRLDETVGNELNSLVQEINAQPFKEAWKADLGSAFMAAAYKVMRQDDIGARTILGVKVLKKYENNFDQYNDSYVHNAYLVYLTAKHFPDRLSKISKEATESFVEMLQTSRYNTLNSALAILALESLSHTENGTVEVLAQVLELDSAGAKTPLVLPKALFPKVAYSAAAAKLQVSASGDQTIYYEVHRSAFERLEGLKEVKSKIEIQREYRKLGTKESATRVAMGDELEVHIHLRSIDNEVHGNVAVVDLIPSGFEVVLERTAHESLLSPELTPELSPKKRGRQVVRHSLHLFDDLWAQILPRAQAQEDYSEGEGEGDGPSMGEGDGDVTAKSGPDEQTAAEIPTLAMPGSTLSVQYEEPREDRVVLYATVTKDSQVYIYKIRATNRGKFRVPPAFAEHLYDRTVQAMGPAGEITVEDKK